MGGAGGGQPVQAGMAVAGAPQQRPRVQGCGVDEGYGAQAAGVVGQGHVGGEQGEAARVGGDVREEVGEAEVDAGGAAGDAEPVGEPVEEVEPVQGARRPQHAVAEVVGAQCVPVGEGMPGGQDGVDGFEADEAVGEGGVQRGVGAAEGGVDVAAQQRLGDRRQVPAVAEGQRSRFVGDFGEGAHGCVQVAPDVDAQGPGGVGDGGDGRIGGGDGTAGGFEEAPAGVGEGDGAGAAQEQAGAEERFQAGDAFGQGLLGEAERGGGPPEVQFLGGADERAYLCHVEIHAAHPRGARPRGKDAVHAARAGGSHLLRQPWVVGCARSLLERGPGRGLHGWHATTDSHRGCGVSGGVRGGPPAGARAR
ncbi:hypothetical protein GCM10020256_45900 [Streptomyces thermocoprophilus]